MPRGGGRSRSSPAPSRSMSSAPPPPRAQPPAPRAPAPAPAQQSGGGGMLSGIGSTIVQGMAFGTGSAIAHRAVGAAASAIGGGSSSEAPQTQQSQPQQFQQQSVGANACEIDLAAFNKCMMESNNNIASCDFYMQALQQCQQANRF